MAEGSGNETPENPGYALFAEDLVNYIMPQNSPRHTVEKEPVPFSSIFHSEIIQEKFNEYLRIIKLLNKGYKNHKHCHTAINPTGYTATINGFESIVFGKVFNVGDFLNCCAYISFIASLFYNAGLDTAPELAKSYIVNILKNRMPADQWNNVRGIDDNFPLPNEQSSESSDSDELLNQAT